MIPKINCQSYLFFKLALFFGLLILTGAAISPPDAYAHDRLLLFYSGNVNAKAAADMPTNWADCPERHTG